MNIYDNVPDRIVQKALFYNFSVEEKRRKEEILRNKDFYYGRHAGHLTLVNEDMDPVVLNLTKPIIKKRAGLLYRRPLTREFVGPAASASFLEEVYRLNNIHQLLLQADLLAELSGSAVFAVYRQDDGTVRLRLYDASSVSPVADDEDPNLCAAISITRVYDKLVDRGSII